MPPETRSKGRDARGPEGPPAELVLRRATEMLRKRPRTPRAEEVLRDEPCERSPGGWNRIQLEVDDLPSVVEALRQSGTHFRNEIVSGRGGKQILLDDPSGNPVELFQ